ncbi:hypothetical protein JTB14_024153 [Gonioctena quinquepunctata]|nr:hypothetical protein JTB14_024153 [Gonioctena quinquepunctata]
MGKIRGTWDEQHMKEPLEKVLTKIMSIRETSQRYSVPESSLADRLKSIRRNEEVIIKPNTYNKGIFHRISNDEQENMSYEHVKELDSQLMPLSRSEFSKLAYQFATKLRIKHRFNKTEERAGKDSHYDFMKRLNQQVCREQ